MNTTLREYIEQSIRSSLQEAKHDYADVVSWVGDKMNNTQMDIDQMRAAFVKKFGRGMIRYFDAAVDELND